MNTKEVGYWCDFFFFALESLFNSIDFLAYDSCYYIDCGKVIDATRLCAFWTANVHHITELLSIYTKQDAVHLSTQGWSVMLSYTPRESAYTTRYRYIPRTSIFTITPSSNWSTTIIFTLHLTRWHTEIIRGSQDKLFASSDMVHRHFGN
jgi:hypothetical protein